MSGPRISVVSFPGSHGLHDATEGLHAALGVIPVQGDEHTLGTAPDGLPLTGAVLPGGFSYGDALRAGALAARRPVMGEVRALLERGGRVLAICNGFQIACEAELLPGALRPNAGGRFLSGWVHVKAEGPHAARWGLERVRRLPIAHGEGAWLGGSGAAGLRDAGFTLVRYVDAEGRAVASACPNGSLDGIAGLISPDGRLLGLMPHPERARAAHLGSDDGLAILRAGLG